MILMTMEMTMMANHKVNQETLSSMVDDLQKLMKRCSFSFDEKAPQGPFIATAVLMKNSETGAEEYIPTELKGADGFKRKLSIPQGWAPQIRRITVVDIHLVDTRINTESEETDNG